MDLPTRPDACLQSDRFSSRYDGCDRADGDRLTPPSPSKMEHASCTSQPFRGNRRGRRQDGRGRHGDRVTSRRAAIVERPPPDRTRPASLSPSSRPSNARGRRNDCLHAVTIQGRDHVLESPKAVAVSSSERPPGDRHYTPMRLAGHEIDSASRDRVGCGSSSNGRRVRG